ncbi:MAG: type II toxin-antitoxin system Phd/YefM family antitoxin [Candidatus Izemoplasmatales bacterium]
MMITTNRIASVTEANQNFTKVAKTAEKYGDTVIFRRNKPAFILLDIDKMGEDFIREYEHLKLKYLSEQLLNEYEVAYKELAK